MKLKLTIASCCILFAGILVSCKKDVDVQDNNPSSVNSSIKVEDGILHFKDNREFFQTMLSVSSMTTQQRKQWEKELGFTSLRSVYDQFNQELDEMEAARNADGFFAVKKKYSKVAIWRQDTAYDLNCSGIIESAVVNVDGLVKVGKELLSFSRDAIKASPAEAGSNGRMADKERIIWTNKAAGNVGLFSGDDYKILGTPPPANSFSVASGPIKQEWPFTTGSPEARGFLQARLFNLFVNGLDRGFVTILYWAEHRNWIGIWRRVRTTALSLHHQSYIRLNTQGVIWPQVVRGDLGPNWADDNVENHESVLIASRELIYNPPILGYLPPTLNNQFRNANMAVTEDNSPNNFWAEYNPSAMFIGDAFGITFSSFGESPLPKIHNFEIKYQ